MKKRKFVNIYQIQNQRVKKLLNETRISISGDIIIMLKNSFGHERLMPYFKNWQEFQKIFINNILRK